MSTLTWVFFKVAKATLVFSREEVQWLLLMTSIESSEKIGFRGLSLYEEYILLNFLAQGYHFMILHKKSKKELGTYWYKR